MRSSSREMSWEENRQSFVQEADEGSVIFRRNDCLPRRHPARKNPPGNVCRRRVPFGRKFWLSPVGGFQITKTLMELAGNRWLKSCMMIRYAVYTPIQKGRIRTHGGAGGGTQTSGSLQDYFRDYISCVTQKCWWVIYGDCFRILEMEPIHSLSRCKVSYYSWLLGIF